jgi:hypothetical protein
MAPEGGFRCRPHPSRHVSSSKGGPDNPIDATSIAASVLVQPRTGFASLTSWDPTLAAAQRVPTHNIVAVVPTRPP